MPDDIQITYYGYEKPGDPDYDPGSAAGLGDRQNQLTPGYSVALTPSERLSRFGVSGKSTGNEFEYNGQTYRDDDTTSTKLLNRRIDIYSPEGPGAFSPSAHKEVDESLLPPSKRLQKPPGEPPKVEYPLADSPEAVDEKPKADTETPLEKFQTANPRFKDWSQDKLLHEMQQTAFPEIPYPKFEIYAKTPGGAKLMQDYLARGLTPLEKFRKFMPGQATGDDEKDLKWMHDQWEPDMPMIQFKAMANPPNGVLLAVANAYQTMFDTLHKAGVATVQGVNAATAPAPTVLKQAFGEPNAAGFMAGMQEAYSKFTALPGAVSDWAQTNSPFLNLKSYKALRDTSGWLEKNVPAYAGANNWFRSYIKNLNERSKGYAAQAQAAASQIPSTAMGQIQGTIQQIAGQAPDIMVSFGLGAGGLNSLLWGTWYEGISGYGDAVEHHQKNALFQGVASGGTRAFQQYLMNTGKGRLVSGILNAFGMAGADEIQKWLAGQPTSIDKEGKNWLLGFLVAYLGASPRQEPMLLNAPEGEPHVSQYDYAGAEDTGAIFNHHGPVVAEELKKMSQAYNNGDIDQADDYANRALSFMPDSKKRELAQGFAKKVDELAGEKPKAALEVSRPPAVEGTSSEYVGVSEVPKEESPLGGYYYAGLPYKPGRHVKGAQEEEPYAIRKLREVNPAAADRWKNEPDPDAKARYLKHLESSDPRFKEPQKSEDSFNDLYFAGFSGVPKAFKEWTDEELPKVVRKLGWKGQEEREMISTARQIIRGEFAKSKAAHEMGPGEIARNQGAIEAYEKLARLKHGDRWEIQRRYMQTRTSKQREQDLIDYEAGRPIKDKLTNYYYQKIHKPWMESLARSANHYGIEFNERLNYIMHNMTHPKDDWPVLKAALAKRGINPDFIKPQEMDIATRLSLKHKLKNDNIVDIDRMRDWANAFAIRRIRIFRQLADHGYIWADDDPNVPYRYKEEILHTKTDDGKGWFVHPDLIPTLNAAFDYDSVFNTIGGPYFKTVSALKGGLSWKLGFSAFHPLHIMDIATTDVGVDALRRIREGKGGPKDYINAFVGSYVPWAPGIAHTAQAFNRYADAVSVMQNKVSFKNVPQETLRDIKDFQDMGLTVEVNRERQMQFSNWINDLLPKWAREQHLVGIGGRILDISNTFNKWWFADVTPRLKFASAMMRRDTLLKTHPELFKHENRPALLREYAKINRDIEGRFGEMDYDNIFWPRMLKQAATTHMLSLGWQIGLFRTMGDGIVDTTRNVVHWNELVNGAKVRGSDKILNDRLAFTAMYVTRGLVTGWAISQLVGHKNVFATNDPKQIVWDGLYPVVGKDANGNERRVNMQYFTKDIPVFHHLRQTEGSTPATILKMAQNKLNPMYSAVFQALMNRDYMNRAIGTMPDQLWYVLKQSYEPISVENLQVPGQGPMDWTLNVLGYTPSGRWTMRSEMENKIITASVEHRNDAKIADARDGYRQAFLAKDKDGMQYWHKEMLKLHVPEKSILRIQKDAHLSSAQKAWKGLSPYEKEEFLKQMTPDERRKYAH